MTEAECTTDRYQGPPPVPPEDRFREAVRAEFTRRANVAMDDRTAPPGLFDALRAAVRYPTDLRGYKQAAGAVSHRCSDEVLQAHAAEFVEGLERYLRQAFARIAADAFRKGEQ